MLLKFSWMLILGLMATNANAVTYHYGFEFVGDTTTKITGPSEFANLAPTQTAAISYDAATFSGGAVLTDATFFPAHVNYTLPNPDNHNAYGTSNMGSAAGLINPLLRIDFLTGDHPTDVSFTLFNGLVNNQGYTITAFDSNNMAYASLDPTFTLGTFGTSRLNSNLFFDSTKSPLVGFKSYQTVNLSFADIAYTTIAPNAHDSATGWDFLIDDVTFIGGGVSPVPEPETYSMMIIGLGLMGLIARRRKQT